MKIKRVHNQIGDRISLGPVSFIRVGVHRILFVFGFDLLSIPKRIITWVARTIF